MFHGHICIFRVFFEFCRGIRGRGTYGDQKIYNNNIVLVEDEKQLEMILLGRGIAFQKKAGDEIDPGRAEKRFVIVHRS